VFTEAKDDGGGGDHWTTGAISHAKLQLNHHHNQTNIQFFLALLALMSVNVKPYYISDEYWVVR